MTMTIGPVVNYGFPCFGGQPGPVLSDLSVLGGVVGLSASPKNNYSSIFLCPYPTTDGVASTMTVQSEFGIDAMGPSFQHTTAFALEAWFTPVYSSIMDDHYTNDVWTSLWGGGGQRRNHEEVLPIVSIGRPVVSDEIESSSASSSSKPADYDWCEGLQLSVAQRGDMLEVRYKDYFNQYYYYYDENSSYHHDDDDYVDDDHYHRKMYAGRDDEFSCRVLLLPEWKLELQELHHVVLNWQWGGGLLEVYGNGILLVRIDLLGSRVLDVDAPIPDIPYSLRPWDQDYRLQLFSNDLVSGHFPGTIHHVSIYNQSLSEETVRTIYEGGKAERAQGVMIDPNNPLYLVASPTADDVLTVQGHPVTFTVGGNYNVSTPYWDILIEILSLPKYGDLRLGLDGNTISAPGDRLSLEQAQPRTYVTYRQRDDSFFTTPTQSFYGELIFPPDHGTNHTTTATTTQSLASPPVESFSYRLIAVDKVDPSRVLGWSESITQNVHIVHLNHPPRLKFPQAVTEPDQQPKEGTSSRPWAMVKDVVLDDTADYNIDRVRVDVWALNGTLSIMSDDIRQMADFESCSNRPVVPSSRSSPYSHWYCFGDGITDRNMTFLATPDNVSVILSNIRYDAFFWDQEDAIIIRIFDGVGGPCLQEEEHNSGRYRSQGNNGDLIGRQEYGTFHDNCFMLTKAIRVPPLSRTFSPGDVGIRGFFNELFDFKGFGIPDLIFWICLVLIIMACCCFVWALNQMCCCFKGARIYVENNPSTPELILASPPPDDNLVWATMDCYEGYVNEEETEVLPAIEAV